MNLLHKLTIKNLKLNKKRTIVTVVGIILSVALITAVATMYSSAVYSSVKFEIKQKGNYHVAFYNVPKNEIATIENNRKVDKTYLTKDIGFAKLANSKNEYIIPGSSFKGAIRNGFDKIAKNKNLSELTEIAFGQDSKSYDKKVGRLYFEDINVLSNCSKFENITFMSFKSNIKYNSSKQGLTINSLLIKYSLIFCSVSINVI